jgi:hypothetical protein
MIAKFASNAVAEATFISKAVRVAMFGDVSYLGACTTQCCENLFGALARDASGDLRFENCQSALRRMLTTQALCHALNLSAVAPDRSSQGWCSYGGVGTARDGARRRETWFSRLGRACDTPFRFSVLLFPRSCRRGRIGWDRWVRRHSQVSLTFSLGFPSRAMERIPSR